MALLWLKRTFNRLLGRVPAIGDPVWWAPKELGGIVTERRADIIVFQGGEIVRNKRGRETPRWTVASRADNFTWHEDLKLWSVGQGPMPKTVRGVIVTPDLIEVKGSFAAEG